MLYFVPVMSRPTAASTSGLPVCDLYTSSATYSLKKVLELVADQATILRHLFANGYHQFLDKFP